MHSFSINSKSIVFISEAVGNIVSQNGIDIITSSNNSIDNKKIPAFYVNQFDLSENKVIDKTWEEEERPVYTGVEANIIYKNGINIAAQFNRLMVANNKQDISDTVFTTKAKNLYKMLNDKEIKPNQIGLNFFMLLSCENCDDYINDNFLNKSVFSKLGKSVLQPYVRVSYEITEYEKLNIAIYTAKKENIKNNTMSGDEFVVLEANYHYELKSENTSANIIIDNSKKKLDLLKKLFSIES